MREIKFRSYSSKFGMKYASIGHGKRIADMIAVYRNGDLMQYTGLKDKNGVEIYEGDIVRYKSQFETYDEVDVNIEEVVFEDGEFIPREGVDTGFNFDLTKFDFEVIGNVYENPELLESK